MLTIGFHRKLHAFLIHKNTPKLSYVDRCILLHISKIWNWSSPVFFILW